MSSGGRIQPVLVNFYEKATDRLLTAEAERAGDRLLVKVRIADVIDVDQFDWGPERRYGLSAHLDFVMVDGETSVPKFAVELDGQAHWSDPKVRQRDRMKDELCEWAHLPLLRITSQFTRQTARWRVLSYVIEAFYLCEAFNDAQEAGQIPDDEPYIVTSFLQRRSDGSLGFNALDQDARVAMIRAHEAEELPSPGPSEFTTLDEATGLVISHAFMALATDRYLVARSRIRDFRFQGVGPSELASQLAVAELGHLATQWLKGEPVACNGETLVKRMAEVQQAIDAGGLLSCGGWSGALAAGGPLPGNASITATYSGNSSQGPSSRDGCH